MTDRKPANNRVLANIPTREQERLRAQLEPVTLKFGEILYQPGDSSRFVYFPIDSMIALLSTVDKRRALGVGLVGNEGMVGLTSILELGVPGMRALVQGGGSALRIASAAFRIEFGRNPALQQALFRYTYALMAQIAQTAACNRFHPAAARLACWLLMTRDRVESDEFSLTHEFLAQMLGVRREGVTQAASALRKSRLIAYYRGRIQIVDARGLLAKSCPCYQIVKAVFERVHTPAART